MSSQALWMVGSAFAAGAILSIVYAPFRLIVFGKKPGENEPPLWYASFFMSLWAVLMFPVIGFWVIPCAIAATGGLYSGTAIASLFIR